MGIQKGPSPNTDKHRRHLIDAIDYILPVATGMGARKARAVRSRKREICR